jgi:cytochrome c oxidase assembly protein subunit 15
VLAIVQIYLGALVAGLRAGLIYNTWPLIDGSFIPSAANLFFDHPLWRNFFENALTVQFDHRMVAYGLCALALIHAVDAHVHRRGEPVATGAGLLAAALLSQAGIGIMTLIRQAPIELALLHQAVALVALTAVTLHAARTLGGRAGTAGVSPALSGGASHAGGTPAVPAMQPPRVAQGIKDTGDVTAVIDAVG